MVPQHYYGVAYSWLSFIGAIAMLNQETRSMTSAIVQLPAESTEARMSIFLMPFGLRPKLVTAGWGFNARIRAYPKS
jgi:hypothetical protein